MGSAASSTGVLAAAVISSTLTIDNILPTVSVGTATPSTGNAGTVFSFPIVYAGGDRFNLTTSNISINGGINCSLVTIVNPTTSTPTVNLSTCIGTGSLGITIEPGASSDLSGNLDTGSEASGTVSVSSGCTTSVVLKDSINNLNSAAGQTVFGDGNFAYMGTASGVKGLQIVDISDPLNLVNKGYYDVSPDYVLDVISEGNIVYLALLTNEVLSIDVTDKNNPILADTFSTVAGQNWGINIIGDYLYVANTTGGLFVINKSDPTNLTQVKVDTAYYGRHIQIEGDRLYGSDGRIIYILDISDPENPSFVASIDLGIENSAYEFYKAGNYIYSIDKPNRVMRTIDISNTGSISVVDTTAAGTLDFRSIDGSSNKLYVGTGSGSTGELRVYDISADPAAPSLDISAPTTERVYELDLINADTVVTANLNGDLQLFKVCAEAP